MSRRSIVVTNLSDAYVNPIAELVQEACKYAGEIILESGTFHINAKSIMGVMALSKYNGLSEGAQLDVVVTGAEEETALNAMEKFLTK